MLIRCKLVFTERDLNLFLVANGKIGYINRCSGSYDAFINIILDRTVVIKNFYRSNKSWLSS